MNKSLMSFKKLKITGTILVMIEKTVKKMQLQPIMYCIDCSPIKSVKNMKWKVTKKTIMSLKNSYLFTDRPIKGFALPIKI
jgi:hypothetical protein